MPGIRYRNLKRVSSYVTVRRFVLVGTGELLGPNLAVVRARKTRLSFSDRDRDTRMGQVFAKAALLSEGEAILGQ